MHTVADGVQDVLASNVRPPCSGSVFWKPNRPFATRTKAYFCDRIRTESVFASTGYCPDTDGFVCISFRDDSDANSVLQNRRD